jgi:hypothetical protein
MCILFPIILVTHLLMLPYGCTLSSLMITYRCTSIGTVYTYRVTALRRGGKACALNSKDYESNRSTELWNHSRLQKTRRVPRKGGFVLSARRPGLLSGRWQCDLRKPLVWLQSLRNLKLNIALRWEASVMLRMLLGVGLSTPSSQKPEAFRNLRKSVREPKLLKTSAPLSTAWRWKTKPLEECRRKSRKKRDES